MALVPTAVERGEVRLDPATGLWTRAAAASVVSFRSSDDPHDDEETRCIVHTVACPVPRRVLPGPAAEDELVVDGKSVTWRSADHKLAWITRRFSKGVIITP